jgi:hypothetical protein
MQKATGPFGLVVLVWFFFNLNTGLASQEPLLTPMNINYVSMVERLKADMPALTKNLSFLTAEYRSWLHAQARSYFAQIESEQAVSSQFFLLVDRHPERQLMLIAFNEAASRNIVDVGYNLISTGNPNLPGCFLTPTGIFANTTKIVGYRAQGTKNEEGKRGLGLKDSRVWDFGWQPTLHSNRGRQETRYIRFAMHATDPEIDEIRLGQPGSQGCVRISGLLCRFIDHYGLIDREYEKRKNERFCSWLLKPDREPVPFAGKYLFVCDSANLVLGGDNHARK